MKLNAVGVSTSNLKKSVQFYTILGFNFPEFKGDEDHLEPIPVEGTARLMLDSEKLMKEITGEAPKPSNHSHFAIEYDSATEVDQVVETLKSAGYDIFKEPWDAFWGQRYAIVQDPDGYKMDLYANL